MKKFRYRFLKNYESCKIETWYTHGEGRMYRAYQNQGRGLINLELHPLIGFPINFAINGKFFYTFFKNCKGYKVKVCTHMDNGLMYCVYQNKGQEPTTLGVK